MHNARAAEKRHILRMKLDESLGIEIWVMVNTSYNHIAVNAAQHVMRLGKLAKQSRRSRVYVKQRF